MNDIEVSNLEEDAQFIRQKLNEYNFGLVSADNHKKLCLVVRREGDTIAGLLGGTYWNWLYIELFWVDKKMRGEGLGSGVLQKAEEIAVQRGCKNAHLETHDFQNLNFYLKRGYVVFGQLENLPEGYTKFYLCKRLVEEPKE